MLKISIIMVICYVIITSTDSRSINMSENEFINDRNSSKYIFQTRFNNTGEKSKNVSTSEHLTHFELTGSQNNSHILNKNQTSAIEAKSISDKETETKEFYDPFNDRTYQKDFRAECNNVTEESKNITAAQNKINVNLTDLQNNSKISNVSNSNQTSVLEDKSINDKENETKGFFDPLNGTTYENKFRAGCNNASEESKNITAPQNIIHVNLTNLQNNFDNFTDKNQTFVTEEKSINLNEINECLDPLSRTHELDLTPNPEYIVVLNNTKKNVVPEGIGNRISTNAIITLTGG